MLSECMDSFPYVEGPIGENTLYTTRRRYLAAFIEPLTLL